MRENLKRNIGVILIHKTTKLILLCSIFASVFLLEDTAFANRYTLSLTSSGAQSINVGNNATISEDSINVATSCRYGYNLSLKTSVNNNNLYLNGNSSNNASGTYFTPVNGTSSLSSQTNTWGYYYNPSVSPTTSSIFSAVPHSGQTAASVISSLATPTITDISDDFSIHYGVSVSSSLVPGTYRMIPDPNNNNNPGTIVYYLTLAQNCIPYTVTFNPASTSIGSSISGTGTMSPQEIYPNEATALSTMSFTPPSGYEFKEWNTEQDGSGTAYQDEELVTDIASPASSITLYAIWHQPRYLYNEVAKMTKGTLAANNVSLGDTITTPTSTDRSLDTSNSGVYTYDPSVYGTASDANNNYPIYFYRGILETNPASTGSLGSANAYPNYVKLDNNTCWRILRTTGSGGVKMIYSGTWGSNTCAKSSTSSFYDYSPYASKGSSSDSNHYWRNITYAGYSYNDSVTDSATATAIGTVFGNNSNPGLNNRRATIRTDVEDNWYANSMTNYTSILEPSAGYCDDRTIYNSSNVLQDEAATLVPYGGDDKYYFGSYIRNKVTFSPSLTCPRNTVDLYRYVENSQGLANELKYPAALLTTDEASFAGSGSQLSGGLAYSSQSFLSINTEFWLLSSHNYSFNGGVCNANLGQGGQITCSNSVVGSYGVRPVISLIHRIFVASGSGTATDPWLITTEDPDEVHPINLYDAVAEQSKGTQSRTDLQTTISTSNSGVYEYNSSIFGNDTDGTKQDNTKATIYYYRGILDDTFTSSTYGSSGDGTLSPNYVILSPAGEKDTSDTCWRIIRTTGSGGVKMIYNGKWTGSTCANAQTNAQTTTSYYNSNGSTAARRIALAGYTYNSYGSNTSTTNNVSPDNMFGSNNSYSGNSNSSVIKGNVESWYTNNLNSYTTILESNAGFCNDRSVYTDTSGTTAASTLRPTGNRTSNGTTAYFGAYSRNGYNSTTRIPSLACPRNIVDVYSTSTNSGGNGQLNYPIALITADELSFAGAGSQTANQGSAYSSSSFVRSGSNFWTMTPNSRTTSNSYATLMYYSNANGYLSSISMYNSYGIRPIISLKEGTEATAGTGTAEDPWVVEAP